MQSTMHTDSYTARYSCHKIHRKDNKRVDPKLKSARQAIRSSQKSNNVIFCEEISTACLSLSDIIQQYGTKLSDGSRLNAVGRKLRAIGAQIPLTVRQQTTSLYISQNDFRSLECIQLFASLRTLSIGGNLLVEFSEIVRLQQLPYLNNLNLVGNPICNYPNYRFRIISILRKLGMLDSLEIRRAERDSACHIALLDEELRDRIIQNHYKIRKFHAIKQKIKLHRDLLAFVVGQNSSNATDAQSLKLSLFDQMPSLDTFSRGRFATLLKVWKAEDSAHLEARNDLELKMLKIVIQARKKILEHPRKRAKELLMMLQKKRRSELNEAQTSNAINDCSLAREIPLEMQKLYFSWYEAYAKVISLQQDTLLQVKTVCEQDLESSIECLSSIFEAPADLRAEVVTKLTGSRCIRCLPSNLQHAEKYSTQYSCYVSHDDSNCYSTLVRGRASLPPQQNDPDKTNTNCGIVRAISLKCPTFDAKSIIQPRKSSKVSADVSQPSKSSRKSGNLSDLLQKSTAKSRDISIENLDAPPIQIYAMRHETSFFDQEECKTQDSSYLDTESVAQLGQREYNSAQETYSEHSDLASEVCIDNRDLDRRFHMIPSRTTQPNTLNDSFASKSNGDANQARNQPHTKTTHITDNRLHATMSKHSDTLQVRNFQDSSAKPMSYDREAKYLNALMASEQRELDLKRRLQQLNQMLEDQKKMLSRNVQEQEHIRREVNQRVQSLAYPKVIRRFFRKWTIYYSTAISLRSIEQRSHRKLRIQNFSAWKDYHRVQKYTAILSQTKKRRLLQSHITAWAFTAHRVYISRQSFYHIRAMKREKEVLVHWRHAVHSIKVLTVWNLRNQHLATAKLLRRVLAVWKSFSTQQSNFIKMQNRCDSVQRLALSRVFLLRWQLFVHRIARPRQRLVTERVQEHRRNILAKSYRAWHRMTRIQLHHARQIKAKMFLRWKQKHSMRNLFRSKKRILNRKQKQYAYHTWKISVQRAIAAKRSLVLARRFSNHRNLRVCWLYWKFYTSSKRKYEQGSAKAWKHYFVKLLRHGWKQWAAHAKSNAVTRKQHTFVEMRRHFDAFRKQMESRRCAVYRQRWLSHYMRRRSVKNLSWMLRRWRYAVTRRDRDTERVQHISKAVAGKILQRSWIAWRQHRLTLWSARVQKLAKGAEQVAEYAERNENEQIMELQEKSEEWRTASLVRENEIQVLKEELEQKEIRIEELENEWQQDRDDLMSKNEQAIRAMQDALDQNELKQQNELLQREIDQLKQRIKNEEQKYQPLRQKFDYLQYDEQESAKLSRDYRSLKKEFESQVSSLRFQLQKEQAERFKAANLLQNYEAEISKTREDIRLQHQESEKEMFALMRKNTNMQHQLDGMQVRCQEMEKLLDEKNLRIAALSDSLEPCKQRHSEPTASDQSADISISISECISSDGVVDAEVKSCGSTPFYSGSDRIISSKLIKSKSNSARLDPYCWKVYQDLQVLQNKLTERLHETTYPSGQAMKTVRRRSHRA